MNWDSDLESIQEVRNQLRRAVQAQKLLEALSQQQIDEIVREMALEAGHSAASLAELAVEETGFGNASDKTAKNNFVAHEVYHAIKDMKTVGVIRKDERNKVWDIAQPVGVIAGIVPSTNPTSTVMFKAMIALKARNAIVFSPHPSAKRCSLAAAERMQAAAERVGAPPDAIQCLTMPSLEATQELMTHKLTQLILATGGKGMVKAAYSSGKPAYGVGPGNVPVYVHRSANLELAAKRILASKIFDYGTICASEQAIVVDEAVKQPLMNELTRLGAHFLSPSDKDKVSKLIMVGGSLNPHIVGKSPQYIAEMAGIVVPIDATVLIAEETEIFSTVPFSLEKLSPLLALYTVQDEQEGCDYCKRLLKLGGLGHTLGIHCEDLQVIEAFGLEKPASRIIVNSGTTFGGIGMSTGLLPSMTLGCGSYGNNITSDNIGPQHLMNIKRVAFGIREIESNQQEALTSHDIGRTINQNSLLGITREEVMEIVKRVLFEAKL
jgi:acetaldehyde dehydrogenase (acetylating)